MRHLSSTSVQAQFKQGHALHQKGQFAQAQALYLQVLAVQPQHFDALHLLGATALQTGRPAEAIQWFDQAIAVNSNDAGVYSNRGAALQALQQYQAAIENLDHAIALNPSLADAHSNRGVCLQALKQQVAALESWDRAIALRPQYTDAYYNRGQALLELKRYQEAVNDFDRAISLGAEGVFIYGSRLHAKAHMCDWKNADHQLKDLERRVDRSEKAANGFSSLSLFDSSMLQYKIAKIWAQSEHPFLPELGTIPEHKASKKIRIGYYSSDFRDHPVAHVIAELFELQDRKRFELIAFSYGPDSDHPVRHRLMRAFDEFIDVRNISDKDVAQLARSKGIDIAVDLNGLTGHNRFGIFSYRAAPVQVCYLGYPGTVGADYMDYLVADKTVIPEKFQPHYSGKIAYLPHCYQVNDRQKIISDRVFTREELGLPPTGFVFCCFNNNYKIRPQTFDSWMRILHQVPGSVLWLAQDNAIAPQNLRKEANARGIDANRLIFAQRVPLVEDYLARNRVADLFIDTLPYNAHSTASDALWAGLPVLTCMGESFASRVAASLLKAIDLPELITTTQANFEAFAVELALNPTKLKGIRQKLERNRLTTPLFDSALFTRHLENAYEQMMQRYYQHLPPEHITVDSAVGTNAEVQGFWSKLRRTFRR